ncbi:MAG: CPBP family glutamic-type intramembrane protease [Ilumatobacteraceae bacterium]
MSLQPPGWYPDPWQPAGLRYWDGGSWTPSAALAPKRPHPALPIEVAWGALLSMALPLVGSRFLLRGLAGLKWPIAVYVVLVGVIAYGPPLAFWRYASRRWGSGNARADIGFSIRWADAGWGPLTWVACFTAEAVVAVVVTATKIPFQNNTDQISAARDNPGYIVPMLILAVIAAPIVEEIVFRGLVLRGLLSRVGPVVAVGAQGVLFGLAHFDPARGVRNIGLILVLSTVGVMFGGACYLLRRLAPTMLAHAILNGIAMAVVLSVWTPGVK